MDQTLGEREAGASRTWLKSAICYETNAQSIKPFAVGPSNMSPSTGELFDLPAYPKKSICSTSALGLKVPSKSAV